MIKKDKQVINNLRKYGGTFEKALADLLEAASSVDYRKCTNVFVDYFEKYRTPESAKSNYK